MNVLPTIITPPMEAAPWTLDVAFPDLGDLLPFAILCAGSLLCTAIWLLAVSRHTGKNTRRSD
jgi:hypothetical protein